MHAWHTLIFHLSKSFCIFANYKKAYTFIDVGIFFKTKHTQQEYIRKVTTGSDMALFWRSNANTKTFKTRRTHYKIFD